MKTRFPATVTALCTVLTMSPVMASVGHHEYRDSPYMDYAKVVDVEPIVRLVRVSEPRRECWDEEVTRYNRQTSRRPGSFTPLVIGGIVGGVVGNQFSKGKRRDALTVAGALLGASVGRDIYRRHRENGGGHIETPYVTTEHRCRVIDEFHEEERVEGYRVTYRYKGKTFVRRMDHDPGRRIRIRVAVTPVID